MNRRFWLPWLWIALGRKQYGLLPDGNEPALFSERYGYRRVRRAMGFRWVSQDRTANAAPFMVCWRPLGLYFAFEPKPPTREASMDYEPHQDPLASKYVAAIAIVIAVGAAVYFAFFA